MIYVKTATSPGGCRRSVSRSSIFSPEDFNSLLGEMEDWQRQLQAKNAQLLRSSLHDPLTGLG